MKDGIHGVSYSLNDGESGWPPVVGKKKRRVDFLMTIPSTESDSDSTSEENLNTVIATGANVDVHFSMVDKTPGLINYKN